MGIQQTWRQAPLHRTMGSETDLEAHAKLSQGVHNFHECTHQLHVTNGAPTMTRGMSRWGTIHMGTTFHTHTHTLQDFTQAHEIVQSGSKKLDQHLH